MPLDYAALFRALGDPTRLRILEFLCGCCAAVAVDDSGDVRPLTGATAGDVCCHVTGVERINSTISAHLKELRLAGLVEVERRGRHMVYRVKREALTTLSRYLAERGTDPTEKEANSDCCQ